MVLLGYYEVMYVKFWYSAWSIVSDWYMLAIIRVDQLSKANNWRGVNGMDMGMPPGQQTYLSHWPICKIQGKAIHRLCSLPASLHLLLSGIGGERHGKSETVALNSKVNKSIPPCIQANKLEEVNVFYTPDPDPFFCSGRTGISWFL